MIKPDFPPAADAVVFLPAEELTDIRLPQARRNARRKTTEAERWMTDEYKLFAGHDGLLVRTVLVRADTYKRQKNVVIITSAADVARLCGHMKFLDQEHIVVLAMNRDNEVAAIFEAAKGPIASARTTAIDVLKVPLMTGCSALILIHNHPGGRPFPSQDDRHLTAKLVEAAKCIGMNLLDHVIVAEDGYFSFLEQDLMP